MVALLGREGVEGLGCDAGVVVQERLLIPLEGFYGLLAVLQGGELGLYGGPSLLQLRQDFVQLVVGDAAAGSEL